MREVYTKNPTLGDPASVDRQLAEIGKKMDILRMELAKYQVRGTKQEAIRKKNYIAGLFILYSFLPIRS